jgi:hypothetical protein
MASYLYRPDHPSANENGLVERRLVAAPPSDTVNIMPDIAPFRTQEGFAISSRSTLRNYEATHGVKQVGTDYPGPVKPPFWDQHRARERAIGR